MTKLLQMAEKGRKNGLLGRLCAATILKGVF
jgi:hypothetical protein